MSEKSSPKNNVVSEIVKKNLCCGCGSCAGICPANALTMKLNKLGEYQPIESDIHKCTNCGLCLSICPFNSKKINPHELWENCCYNTPIIGPHCGTYVGYSLKERQRLTGASGGVATWFVQKLLELGWVDSVICVGKYTSSPFRLFHVCKTPQDLQNSSTSSYYPVELSSILRYIKNNPGNYAITALPCLAKALRHAANKLPWLKERMKYIIGLVCGGQRGTFFAQYLAQKHGIAPEHLKGLQFRVKNETKTANNFGLSFLMTNNESKTIYRHDGMDSVWYRKWFMLNSCQFCEDVFADYADISFMDAWLDGYRDDYRGHSLWIIRNQQLATLLDKPSDLKVSDISPELVCKSQDGLINYKINLIKTRCYLAHSLGQNVPIYMSKEKTNLGFRKNMRVKNEMKRLLASSRIFAGTNSVPEFEAKMKKYDIIESIINLPVKVYMKIRKFA